MVSGKEEEEAPRKCVKCDQNLPRESFSRKQWQNTPLKRRCLGCTDVTQAEETNKKIKKLPPKEIWNMDKMNEDVVNNSKCSSDIIPNVCCSSAAVHDEMLRWKAMKKLRNTLVKLCRQHDKTPPISTLERWQATLT